jgi:hypothetical protein
MGEGAEWECIAGCSACARGSVCCAVSSIPHGLRAVLRGQHPSPAPRIPMTSHNTSGRLGCNQLSPGMSVGDTLEVVRLHVSGGVGLVTRQVHATSGVHCRAAREWHQVASGAQGRAATAATKLLPQHPGFRRCTEAVQQCRACDRCC